MAHRIEWPCSHSQENWRKRGSLVGRILERRLDCGPTGCFQKGKYVGLETAKFHLLLGKSIGTPFAEDFDETTRIELFSKIQNNIASTQNHQNFLIVEGQEKQIRFTRRVFEKGNANSLVRLRLSISFTASKSVT